MGPQFHETGYGRMFFQSQLPNLIKAINRLAEAIEKQNGNVNIIDITCDSKKCERTDLLVNCLNDEKNSKCIVPDFTGKTKEDVLKWLNSISTIIDIEYKSVESSEKDGTVLGQSVSGISIKDLLNSKNKLVITIANNGSLVDCLNDENNGKCVVPNFVGKTK